MIGYSHKCEQNNAYLYKLLPNGEIKTLNGIIGRSSASTFFIHLTAIGDYKVEYVSDFDFVKYLFMDKIKEDIKCKKTIIKTNKSLLKNIRKQESN